MPARPIALGIPSPPYVRGRVLLAGPECRMPPPPNRRWCSSGTASARGRMSQYGARLCVRWPAGTAPAHPIAHYYPPRDGAGPPPRTNRVLLAASTPAVTVSARRAWRVVGPSRGAAGSSRCATDAVNRAAHPRRVWYSAGHRRVRAPFGSRPRRPRRLSCGRAADDEDRPLPRALRVVPAVDGVCASRNRRCGGLPARCRAPARSPPGVRRAPRPRCARRRSPPAATRSPRCVAARTSRCTTTRACPVSTRVAAEDARRGGRAG